MKPIILPFDGIMPVINDSAYVAPGAAVTGDVVIGEEASLWFNVSIRGDVGKIRIGARSNVQDNSVVHITGGLETIIKDEVTIGHGCILHSCHIHDNAVVGMGSTLLDNSVVETEAMLAAGSLLTPGKIVPSRQLWAGRPARYVRDLTDNDVAEFGRLYREYVRVSRIYLKS